MTAAEFDSYCVTAPSTNPNVPVAGEQICGFYDVKPAFFGRVDNYVTKASNYGSYTEVYNGVDITVNARILDGGVLTGGLSAGQTVVDNCEVRDALPETNTGNPFCRTEPSWAAATSFKLGLSTPIPGDFQLSVNFQNNPGIDTQATWSVGTAQVTPSLGRPLASGGTTVLTLVEPSTLYREGRINQLNLALSRNFRMSGLRIAPRFELHNALNANPILSLINRMAPMTRNRADPGALPSEMAVVYYRQRATAGLIVTEGTAPSPAGLGYARTPSIHSDAHIMAWKRITDAVHAEGSRIFLQLMHVGRIGHSANRLSKDPLVAPSAIRAAGQIVTDSIGMQEFELPRALETDEIPGVIAEYGQATRNAISAGFDGVELHCGSGYLPMQFLSTGTNKRTDGYGGNLKNRLQFVLEVLEEMADAAGSASRVSIKISPAIPFNDISDDDPLESHLQLAKAISPMGLAFLQVVKTPPLPNIVQMLRPVYKGVLAAVGGFDRETGNAALASGLADFIVFGKLFTSNPDLPDRFAKNRPLTPWDASTFYTRGAQGYIHFASASESAAGEEQSERAIPT